MSGEAAIRACALSMSGAVAIVISSHGSVLTAVALILAGTTWIMARMLCSVGVRYRRPARR